MFYYMRVKYLDLVNLCISQCISLHVFRHLLNWQLGLGAYFYTYPKQCQFRSNQKPAIIAVIALHFLYANNQAYTGTFVKKYTSRVIM